VVGHSCKTEFDPDNVDMTSESFQKLVYREGNELCLRDHQGDTWVFNIGIRAQESDLAKGILGGLGAEVEDPDPLEPGELYWMLETWWPEEELATVGAPR